MWDGRVGPEVSDGLGWKCGWAVLCDVRWKCGSRSEWRGCGGSVDEQCCVMWDGRVGPRVSDGLGWKCGWAVLCDVRWKCGSRSEWWGWGGSVDEQCCVMGDGRVGPGVSDGLGWQCGWAVWWEMGEWVQEWLTECGWQYGWTVLCDGRWESGHSSEWLGSGCDVIGKIEKWWAGVVLSFYLGEHKGTHFIKHK